ncbi:MAG: flagellar biosynthetic protein FliO [Oscillospiraceae bacterium]|nr:flagellar biosynthetic protein FliO [Oscillospiraceae bacterium]
MPETTRLTLQVIGIIIIMFGAYYATAYIGKKASGRSSNKWFNRNARRLSSIRLVEQFAISRDKIFYIVEIAGKIYIIGATNQSMTLLDTLDVAQFDLSTAKMEEAMTQGEMATGGSNSKILNKLSSFISGNNSQASGTAAQNIDKQAAFADSMKSANEYETSEKRDARESEQSGNSEGEE